MKHTLYYIAFLLLAVLLPTGCTEDKYPEEEIPAKKVTWKIGVIMPQAREATRAFGETAAFTDLHLAVFSEVAGDWYLEELVQADAPVTTTAADQLTEFSVELTSSDQPRRIHLVGNYPGLTLPFGNEGTLIGLLSVKDNHDVYWGYVDVDKIGKDLPEKMQRIPLVRNFAKVQLEINEGIEEKFVLTGFALHNVPNSGTAAPYNISSGKFADFVASDNVCQTYEDLLNEQGYEGNEPYDVELIPATEATEYHKPEGTNGPIAPFYIYERHNRNVDNPTSVIVKGRYEEGDETFYKLDIIYHNDITNTNVYYNLLRNFIYTIRITDVTGSGYKTLNDALINPASNNISGSTEVNDFTNISDGKGRLFVSTTYLLLTSDAPVDVYYQYRPDLENDPNGIDNTPKEDNGTGLVTITAPAGNVLSEAAGVADEDETSGTHSGWRKLTLKPNVPDGVAKTQQITVAAGNLQREITLVLRRPYDMIVQVDPKIVDPSVGKQIQVSTSIPSGLPPSVFPLLFVISTENNTLYPLPGSGMYAQTAGGTYGFVRELSYEEYKELPVSSVDATKVTFSTTMQTNCEDNATTVYVDNPYFNRGSDYFINPFKTGNINVAIQKSNSQYPQTIYNNGNNDGTIVATAKYNGADAGTVTISKDKVVSSGLLLPADATGNVEFEFQDTYYLGKGQWSSEKATYTATCTVAQLTNGTTLNFTTSTKVPLRELSVPSLPVRIQRILGYNPQRIYNNNNAGTETVTVTYNGSTTVGTDMIINANSVQSSSSLYLENGEFDPSKTLTFTFDDNYRTYQGGQLSWSTQATTYTASCTVQELLDGTADLYFETNLNGITLNNPVKVQTFTRSYTRYNQTYTRNVYPQKLENSEQGTEAVNVYHNGVKIAETSIYRESFSDQEFFIPIDGASSETITFEFSDQYCTSLSYNNYNLNYTWNGSPISFKEEISIQDLNNGETVYFETDEIKMYNSIDIKEGNETITVISIPKYNDDYYPMRITQGDSETVSVSYNGTKIGTIYIKNENSKLIITRDATLSSDTALEESYELEFEFTDYYYRNNGGNWRLEDTYTATCTVGDLINGTAQLNFER